MNTLFNTEVYFAILFLLLLLVIFILLLSSLIVASFTRHSLGHVIYDTFLVLFLSLLVAATIARIQHSEPLIVFYVFYYAPATYLILSVIEGLGEKRLICFIDALASVLLLPCLQFSQWTLLYYLLGLLYFLFRTAYYLFDNLNKLNTTINRYTLKESLDHLPSGLAINDKQERIQYINVNFSSFLERHGISPRQKASSLFKTLSGLGKTISPTSAIIKEGPTSYLLSLENNQVGSELTLVDITHEAELQESLQAANETLRQDQLRLFQALDSLKEMEKEEQKEKMHQIIHDFYAEDVSLLHQVLINPKAEDLRGIKELILAGPFNANEAEISIEDVLHDYRILGVSFQVEGSLEGLIHQKTAREVIREGIDNAIRHGNSSLISIKVIRNGASYSLYVSNNGSKPSSLTMHNGLKTLKKAVENEGGHFSIELEPQFTLKAEF